MAKKQIHHRFSDLPWYQYTISNKRFMMVTVGGAGGIGSWTSLLLAKAGIIPIIYDADLIEEHNIGGQSYGRSDIGRLKTEAIFEQIMSLSDVISHAHPNKIEDGCIVSLVTVSAFDNMNARKFLFEKWEKLHGTNPLAMFVDGRLEAESMQIYCIRGGDTEKIKEYREVHLFEDTKIEHAPCSAQQTSHTAAMIASHIVGFITNHITNVAEGDEVRDVPFRWEYFIPASYVDSQPASQWKYTS